ncbi:MAG: hypothetical protein HUU35_16400, partial [Armatimonadetes bacterium]|nr:hypothetical protein [Armatimonadota bacterium]
DDLERVIAEFECLVLERQAEALRRRRNAPEVQDFEAQAALYKEWIALQQRLDETRRTLNNASGMR